MGLIVRSRAMVQLRMVACLREQTEAAIEWVQGGTAGRCPVAFKPTQVSDQFRSQVEEVLGEGNLDSGRLLHLLAQGNESPAGRTADPFLTAGALHDAPEVVILPGLAAPGYLIPLVRKIAAWTQVTTVDLPGWQFGRGCSCARRWTASPRRRWHGRPPHPGKK